MLHRYGSVAESLALRLLALQPGDRLDPVGQLAAEFGTGRGTVQSAFRVLTQEGAVVLHNRGSLGAFVKEIDYHKLLDIADLSPIIGVMALPYSIRFQGLSTGLAVAFEQARLPLVLAHLRGARSRLHFLRTGRCSFAVISRLAWEEEQEAGDLKLLFSFGPGSNVGEHVLVLANPEARGITDGMRVGLDPSSHDHLRLTAQECRGKAVELVHISYAEIASKLTMGEIDAAIWDASVALPLNLQVVMLPLQHRHPTDDPNTEAVLVVRAEMEALGRLLQRHIDPSVIRTVQQQVVAGERLAAF
ncbi:MAG: GntR family transcriptional regulator YhfZ [Bacillota bacterium]